MCNYKITDQSIDSSNISFYIELSQVIQERETQRNPNQLTINIEDNFEPEYINNNTTLQIKTGLQNPTEKCPANITEFLGKNLDINFLKKHLESQYGNMKYHNRYPIDAMIKAAMIRRLKCMKSFQKLVNRFEKNPIDCKNIGFKENKRGNYEIPDRKTFWHWENKRISTELLQEMMDLMVKKINEQLNKLNIILGKRIGIDATPLEALYNDPDAKYNEHYKIKGYKIHGVIDLDYNIPLALFITPANIHDSQIFKLLLQKLKQLGIKFEKVYADAAYDTYEHFAIVHIKYKAKFYTRLHENAIFNEKGTEEQIQHEYNKLWKKPDYISPDQATINDKLKILMKYEKHRIVGAYFRNMFLEKSEQKLKNKNIRNAAEGFHGFVKEYLNLQRYLDYRGIRNVERHIRWTYLAVLGITLARLQNGITENLTQIAYFE